ncbi:hypothetical protein KAW43_02100 [Candidatus Parcubacteria bacterium]|nr:hypothetical protein [Candidatus Parcubacteria bacterium]
MSKQGQYNYKGINAQAWAAMSLFLQYLRDFNFSYIQLEAPKFEDFNLVFNDERKIICESKNWEGELNFSHLKNILNSILKKTTISEKDEILIVCTKLNKTLKSKVENMKYWSEFVTPEFKKKKFSNQQIATLNKVRFWQVQEKDNHLIVYSLFSELLDFWLPEDELESKANSILIKRIYEGSAKGAIYRKEGILNEIESIRKKVSKYSGYFDDERVKTEVQLQNLITAIEDNKAPEWAQSSLSALSSKPALMFFVLDRIKDKKIDNLKDWNNLWELYRIYRFSFSLFRIFESNLHTENNKKYILEFFKSNLGRIRRFYQQEFFDVDVVKITKKILDNDKDNKFIDDVFEIVKKLITDRREDIFYLKAQRDSSWERGEVAKLLKEVHQKADSILREKIYKLIVDTFNLVKDDGKFSHYTPSDIFTILKQWLDDDFKNRFKELTKKFVSQYQELYGKHKGKEIFNGWELSGGMTSSVGHHYTVGDRHFIGFVLEPAIKKYYNDSKNKNLAWKFIFQNCISKTDSKTKSKVIKKAVSKNRPDFLNRATLPIVLERYQSSNRKISEEAFEILKEFILSRRGIPHKTDLIYQELRNRPNLSDYRKWKLVEVSTEKYGIPVSVFVEEIVSQLAKRGHEKAKEELKKWLKNPKYYERFRAEINVIQNIRTIMESDFDSAIEMFNDFIGRKQFIKKYDNFETYEVAILLHDILKKYFEKKDFAKGLEILKKLATQKTLSKNQQIILCFSLFNYRGNDQSDDIELLEKVYKEFINPFLDNLDNDINKIVKKLTFSQAREALVQFSERLARNKKIKEALRIIEVFINDPDPYLPGKDSEDPENKYNEHQRIENGKEPGSITSTRGWCAWVLMKCSVLSGRDYLKELIDLTEKLTKDENWYVKHMACFTLSQLAQNRLTVLPDDRNVLFFGKDKKEALERAKKIEKTAFRLLMDIAKASDNVKKALAKSILTVFNHIRILNEKDALIFVNRFKEFPDEAIAEAAPLFIFFAEFRKDAFKNWKWKTTKYYNDLGPDKYNDKKFKKILFEAIDKIEPKQRFSFVVQFEHLIRDLNYKSEDAEKLFNLAYKYLNHLSKEYNHEVFNVIYMTIKEGMEKKCYFDEWYNLYIQCLKTEKTFYDENFRKEKTMEMSWWPSLYNEDILILFDQQGDKQKFLDAFDLITQFPKELEIHDSDKIISLLRDFPKTNKQVKKIVVRLFQRNPVRYYEFKKQLK